MSKILIVDDDAIVRKSIRATLEAAGHDSLEACDGEAGLEVLQKNKIDLAIVDIWMPKVDGLNFLRQLPEEFQSIPVVMISGGGTGATLEQATTMALVRGASEILFKPFEPDELIAVIDKLL